MADVREGMWLLSYLRYHKLPLVERRARVPFRDAWTWDNVAAERYGLAMHSNEDMSL